MISGAREFVARNNPVQSSPSMTLSQSHCWLGRRGLVMKLASLLLVGCWFAVTGCDSGRNQERQAVSDVEKVVAFFMKTGVLRS